MPLAPHLTVAPFWGLISRVVWLEQPARPNVK
jgi:hypothetical protein